MLKIDEATWNAIMTEAQAAIDRLNERCTGHFVNYCYALMCETAREGTVWAKAVQLYDGRTKDRRYLAWCPSDGSLLKVRPKRRGRQVDLQGFTVTAASWAKAAAKSPQHLLAVTRLVDFHMIHIGDVYVADETFIGPRGGE